MLTRPLLKWFLLPLLLLLLFSGCYTQLRPPLNPNPPAAQDSTAAGDSSVARDTVYMEVVKEYHYPSYHPEIWYYGVRHHRWRNYYYTPYWQHDYRSDYWSNYWYDYWQRRYPVSPSPGTTSPPVIQSPTSKRRRLRFIKPSQPKDTSTKESNPKYQDVESSDSSSDDEDQDEEQPEKKKSNKRKKLKW